MSSDARQPEYRTLSGLEVKPVYGPETATTFDFDRDLGLPGEFPFTRGPYPDMYRGRLWTRRQIAGFGTPQATNERYRFLLEHGQTGISTDFDHPTLTGYDSDHELAEGEVGRLGVAIDTVRDMDDLFHEIPLDKVSVSLTINHPSIVLLSMFLAVAQGRGVNWAALRGTVQNDSLKEFHGQKTFALGPEPSLKLTTDIVEFCTEHVPNWYTISISGYHTRESGSDAVQELAFTIAQGMAYVESALARGMPVDSFAPRLSFFFGVHNDIFEEIAKFRAARRMWARIVKERYGATRPGVHADALPHPDPRLDADAPGRPEQHRAGNATGVGCRAGWHPIFARQRLRRGLRHPIRRGHAYVPRHPVDYRPRVGRRRHRRSALGGSLFVESLTSAIEDAAQEYITRIDEMGNGSMRDGILQAIGSGYIEREIARSAYEYQQRIESGQQVIVGLNQYQSETQQKLELFQFDPEEEEWQKARLAEARSNRSPADVRNALSTLKQSARDDANLMPATLGAVTAMATEGEVLDTLRDVYGEYVDPGVF